MRAREGSGRHRQAWITTVCECCGLTVQARRTRPGRPLHVRSHFTEQGHLCECQTAVKVVA